MFVDKKCYEYFQGLAIDEERKIVDISEHNEVLTEFKIQLEVLDFSRAKVMKMSLL